ncbi:hypothetical protein C8P63_102200 [Melghirimyces profundicolus]|uniref:Uncharacterized protein n=1 Tax=Melghirimyces profundicolus TaxID=1242148 RepID=A0A2T6C8R4_9BACL|nr:hypothetical protein [Melghirimyces profundicolus]PTX64705.1 hypothetical protein C8P63_102200 [Melghirimyces profundicolus]
MGTEKRTMEERIQAFYQQSGGPNNREIARLLEEHLLNGRDHGMTGYKETFEDAVMDTIIQDPSLLLLFERIQRWRLNRNGSSSGPAHLEESVQRLEKEIHELKQYLSNKPL